MATGRRRTLVVLALLLVGVVTLDTVGRGVVALVVSSWTVGSGVIPEHSRMRGSTPPGVPSTGAACRRRGACAAAGGHSRSTRDGLAGVAGQLWSG